ncbi:MAG: hypothetical protein ABR579_05820 [Actinomycetota bacterium]
MADYLGRLVDKELNRAHRAEDRRAERMKPVQQAGDEFWVPPWEE